MRNDFGIRHMVAMKSGKGKLPACPTTPRQGRMMGEAPAKGKMGSYKAGGAVKAMKVTDGKKSAPKAMKKKV